MSIHYCNDKISHPRDKGNVFIFSKKEKKRKEKNKEITDDPHLQFKN
jgi:hypothetical protein